MGRYSSDSEDDRRRKKKKKHRSRSRSRSSSYSSYTKKKSKKKSRKRSPVSRSRSRSSEYRRRRSRSRSSEKSSRHHKSRSKRRSRSRDRHSSSRTQRRRSRSRSGSRSRCSSRDRKDRKLNSPSPSEVRVKDEKNDPARSVPGFDDLSLSEQNELRMQMALKAAGGQNSRFGFHLPSSSIASEHHLPSTSLICGNHQPSPSPSNEHCTPRNSLANVQTMAQTSPSIGHSTLQTSVASSDHTAWTSLAVSKTLKQVEVRLVDVASILSGLTSYKQEEREGDGDFNAGAGSRHSSSDACTPNGGKQNSRTDSCDSDSVIRSDNILGDMSEVSKPKCRKGKTQKLAATEQNVSPSHGSDVKIALKSNQSHTKGKQTVMNKRECASNCERVKECDKYKSINEIQLSPKAAARQKSISSSTSGKKRQSLLTDYTHQVSAKMFNYTLDHDSKRQDFLARYKNAIEDNMRKAIKHPPTEKELDATPDANGAGGRVGADSDDKLTHENSDGRCTFSANPKTKSKKVGNNDRARHSSCSQPLNGRGKDDSSYSSPRTHSTEGNTNVLEKSPTVSVSKSAMNSCADKSPTRSSGRKRIPKKQYADFVYDEPLPSTLAALCFNDGENTNISVQVKSEVACGGDTTWSSESDIFVPSKQSRQRGRPRKHKLVTRPPTKTSKVGRPAKYKSAVTGSVNGQQSEHVSEDGKSVVNVEGVSAIVKRKVGRPPKQMKKIGVPKQFVSEMNPSFSSIKCEMQVIKNETIGASGGKGTVNHKIDANKVVRKVGRPPKNSSGAIVARGLRQTCASSRQVGQPQKEKSEISPPSKTSNACSLVISDTVSEVVIIDDKVCNDTMSVIETRQDKGVRKVGRPRKSTTALRSPCEMKTESGSAQGVRKVGRPRKNVTECPYVELETERPLIQNEHGKDLHVIPGSNDNNIASNITNTNSPLNTTKRKVGRPRKHTRQDEILTPRAIMKQETLSDAHDVIVSRTEVTPPSIDHDNNGPHTASAVGAEKAVRRGVGRPRKHRSLGGRQVVAVTDSNAKQASWELKKELLDNNINDMNKSPRKVGRPKFAKTRGRSLPSQSAATIENTGHGDTGNLKLSDGDSYHVCATVDGEESNQRTTSVNLATGTNWDRICSDHVARDAQLASASHQSSEIPLVGPRVGVKAFSRLVAPGAVLVRCETIADNIEMHLPSVGEATPSEEGSGHKTRSPNSMKRKKRSQQRRGVRFSELMRRMVGTEVKGELQDSQATDDSDLEDLAIAQGEARNVSTTVNCGFNSMNLSANLTSNYQKLINSSQKYGECSQNLSLQSPSRSEKSLKRSNRQKQEDEMDERVRHRERTTSELQDEITQVISSIENNRNRPCEMNKASNMKNRTDPTNVACSQQASSLQPPDQSPNKSCIKQKQTPHKRTQQFDRSLTSTDSESSSLRKRIKREINHAGNISLNIKEAKKVHAGRKSCQSGKSFNLEESGYGKRQSPRGKTPAKQKQSIKGFGLAKNSENGLSPLQLSNGGSMFTSTPLQSTQKQISHINSTSSSPPKLLRAGVDSLSPLSVVVRAEGRACSPSPPRLSLPASPGRDDAAAPSPPQLLPQPPLARSPPQLEPQLSIASLSWRQQAGSSPAELLRGDGADWSGDWRLSVDEARDSSTSSNRQLVSPSPVPLQLAKLETCDLAVKAEQPPARRRGRGRPSRLQVADGLETLVTRRKPASKYSGKPVQCEACGKVFANRYLKSTKLHLELCCGPLQPPDSSLTEQGDDEDDDDLAADRAGVLRRKLRSAYLGRPVRCRRCHIVFANRYLNSTKRHLADCRGVYLRHRRPPVLAEYGDGGGENADWWTTTDDGGGDWKEGDQKMGGSLEGCGNSWEDGMLDRELKAECLFAEDEGQM